MEERGAATYADRAPVPFERLESLRQAMRGMLCLKGAAGYDEARIVWNAMIDRKPAMIARAQSADDVVTVVDFARENHLELAVKGGGHNIAGNAVSDGGIMLDLSLLKSIRIDAAARTAEAGPGVTLGELDRAAQAHGLALPLGINSTTGIAGLTLGGGFGWISRRHGLTIDNLIAADVVTADGQTRRASEGDDADLFWGIRGGGGNLGVVTRFEYGLHEVGPEIFAGLIVFPLEGGRDVLLNYREIVSGMSDDLTVWAIIRQAPPLPFVPAEWHGREVVVLAFCDLGDASGQESVVARLRGLGRPVAEHFGPVPFAGWQSTFDPLLAPGARNYWKSHEFRRLEDGAIDAMIEAAAHLPSPESEVFLAQLGGAINRVPVEATAYPHRDVAFVMNAHARWRVPGHDAACMKWARELFDATARFATGGVYVNFMPADEARRVETGAYGPNYARLARMKARYDPGNLFRVNQNVPPAKASD